MIQLVIESYRKLSVSNQLRGKRSGRQKKNKRKTRIQNHLSRFDFKRLNKQAKPQHIPYLHMTTQSWKCSQSEKKTTVVQTPPPCVNCRWCTQQNDNNINAMITQVSNYKRLNEYVTKAKLSEPSYLPLAAAALIPSSSCGTDLSRL